MSNNLTNEVDNLGRRLTVKDVAARLKIDVRAVRKYYKQLGGFKLGPRTIIFFESELVNGIQNQRCEEAEQVLDGPSEVRVRKAQKSNAKVPHQKRSGSVGKEDRKHPSSADKYGIFS